VTPLAVHFVYRGDDAGPTGVSRTVVNAPTVLDALLPVWDWAAGKTDEELDEELPLWAGPRGYGRCDGLFRELGYGIALDNWPRPKSLADLIPRLREDRGEDTILDFVVGPNHLAILDHDGVYQFAYFVFDDEFAAANPDRVAYLLRDGWKLPAAAQPGTFTPAAESRAMSGFPGDGWTQFVLLHCGDARESKNYRYGPYRIDGVRLADLPRFLFSLPAGEELENKFDWPFRTLAASAHLFADTAEGEERVWMQAVRTNPGDAACWAAYSDWLEERGQPPAGVRVLTEVLTRCECWYWDDSRWPAAHDRVEVGPHVARAAKALDRGSPQHGEGPRYSHFVLFDDLWAAAHPHLANSVLRLAGHWHPLGPDG
jgi:uncharacterized protein (TIGR02996 family)